MINIKVNIQNVEYNTETDENIMSFMQGTLYKKDEQYYLFCESVLLNNCVYWGKAGNYNGDLPTIREVSEDTVDNFDEHTRKMIPLLGDEPLIPRKITKSITLLPLEKLTDLFIDEINKSKIDIGNSIIITKGDSFIEVDDSGYNSYNVGQWNFEGSTYSLNLHDNVFCRRSDNIIPISDDEYWIKVNPGDDVINTKTDKRGYPQSCGVENKNKDVIIIVKNNEEVDMGEDIITIEELNSMIADAKKQGIRTIEIDKKIFIESGEVLRGDVLNDEKFCINFANSDGTQKPSTWEVKDFTKGE